MIAARFALKHWLLFVAIATAGIHVAAVAWFPDLLMGRAIARLGRQAGVNAMGFPPPATDAARTIVRPSPDLLYSVCAFDLRQHNLHIRAAIPEAGYWSLALYGANTNTFLVVNNRGGAAPVFETILTGPGSRVPDAGHLPILQAPSFTGILLIRRLISSPAALPAEDAARRTAVCEAMAK